MKVVAHSPRPHVVFRLFRQTAPLRALHLLAVAFAPFLRRRRDYHVLNGALENLGQENVEGVGDSAQHLNLLAPVLEGLRHREPGLLRRAFGLGLDGGDRLRGELLGEGHGLLPRRGGVNVRAGPRRVCHAHERPELRGVFELGLHVRELSPQGVDGVGIQSHPAARRALALGQPRQPLQKRVHRVPPLGIDVVQRSNILAELAPDGHEARPQLQNVGRVFLVPAQPHARADAARHRVEV